MKQAQFMARYETVWLQLEVWFKYLTTSKRKRKESPAGDFTELYRETCHHLALAQARHYSPALIARLNQLVVDGHQQLYKERAPVWTQAWNFLALDLPAQIRAQWKVVLLAALLLYGSMGLLIGAIQWQPDLVYSIIDADKVAGIEAMYDPSLNSRLGRERESDSDVMMFGFYIRNNTSIGFQAFTSGILFGIGTLFVVLYNGIFIGAVAGHLTYIGFGSTFWSFVVGHSAFELTAIVLSGAAGFKLAQALIFPGRYSRRFALRQQSRIAVQLVYGAALLFLLAAFVEAFWSSNVAFPNAVKYWVGAALWVLILAWFGLAGRGHTAKVDV